MYNQAQYLPEALESVLLQTYSNWECIIVNDGSEDDTDEIAGIWCTKDGRIKYFRKQNGGPSSAAEMQECLLPKAHLFYRWMQMTLLTLPILKKRSILSLVIHLQRWYIARQLFLGKDTRQSQLPEYSYSGLLLQNPIFCSCIFRLKDALAIGLYDENLKTGVEDWEFLLRLLNENSKVD